MTFVTRARARVDRMACPWLIRRFIDPDARILFVHHGDLCSFDAFLNRYDLDDPALRMLAVIVRGADTDRLDLAAEAAGLFAIATGFQRLMPDKFIDDDAMLTAETPMYDALYEFCKTRVGAP